jgi:hypothetical protein
MSEETVNVIENKQTPHVSDGVTYSRPKIYKCKNCKQRLTSEEFKETNCPESN